MVALQKNINALIILTICGILLGAYGVQFFWKETPCPLCLLQRIGMIALATSLALNLRFGIRPQHYGIGLFCCLFGGTVALRQISLHVCPGFPEFGIPVLGISLYTWSFFVFACSVLAIGILLCLYTSHEEKESSVKERFFHSFAIGFLLAVTAANVITTFLQCGLGDCE